MPAFFSFLLSPGESGDVGGEEKGGRVKVDRHSNYLLLRLLLYKEDRVFVFTLRRYNLASMAATTYIRRSS